MSVSYGVKNDQPSTLKYWAGLIDGGWQILFYAPFCVLYRHPLFFDLLAERHDGILGRPPFLLAADNAAQHRIRFIFGTSAAASDSYLAVAAPGDLFVENWTSF